MKLLTWNIRLCRDSSIAEVAGAIRRVGADLVVLQEVGRDWVMGAPGDQTHDLAQRAGYPHSRFFPALFTDPSAPVPFAERLYPMAEAPAEAVGLPRYGIALLSRRPFCETGSIPLPRERDEPRILAWAVLPGVTVFLTHLSVLPGEREAQAQAVLERITATPGPVLLLGDLNDIQGSAALAILGRALEVRGIEGGPSYPAASPRARIDHVLAGPRATPEDASPWRVVTPATPLVIAGSDHLPVYAVCELKARRAGGPVADLARAVQEYARCTGRRLPEERLAVGRAPARWLYRRFVAAAPRVDLGGGAGEWMALELGLKPMVREIVPAATLSRHAARCRAAGFLTEVAPLVSVEDGREGLVTTSGATSDGGRSEDRIVFIGRDAAMLARATDLERQLAAPIDIATWRELTVELGALLGYPACCCRAFAALSGFERNKTAIRASAARSEVFDPRLNNLQLTTFHFIGWFPCRYDCAASLAFAEPLRAHLARTRPDAHNTLMRALAMPRLYFDDRRQLVFDARARAAHEVRYERVYTPYAFDRRREWAAFEWVFYVDVGAPFAATAAARRREDGWWPEGGTAPAVGVDEAVWLPFGPRCS